MCCLYVDKQKYKQHFFMPQCYPSPLLLVAMAIGLCLYSCKKKDEKAVNVKKVQYQGPMVEAKNTLTFYSDSAKLKIKLAAKLRLEYKNGDQDFPQGIVIDFYNRSGQNESRLTADKGKFIKEKRVYTAIGNVVVENLLEQKKLLTEELHWTPDNQTVYTEPDMLVHIITPAEKLDGYGLKAKQDLSVYRLARPQGILSVQQ